MPPDRQDLAFHNPSRLCPALGLLPMRFVQVEQRTDRVSVGRAFGFFLFGGVGPVENPSAVLRGGLACVCQEDVWVAPKANSPDSAVCR